ncbi:MAG: DUF4348 domain-containing protein [Ignavibacteriaceae bacterium]
MLKLKINIFVAEDGFVKEYPVTIFDGNIKPDIPNGLPYCQDERVNFQYQFAPTYKDISNNKVNTRFLYPYSRTYKKAEKEGIYAAYASLNLRQRIKLSFINKTSVFHKHPISVIFIVLNFIGLIPLWLLFLFPDDPQNNPIQKQNPPQKIEYKQAEIDSSQVESVNTLQINKEDFYQFILQFSNDSTFQINRIMFPLEVISISKNLTNIDTIKTEKEELRFLEIGIEEHSYRIQFYDNFEEKLRDSDERVLAFEGIENGISESYLFKLFRGKWFLVNIKKLST